MRTPVFVGLSLLLCLGIASSSSAATIDFADQAVFGDGHGAQSFTWTLSDVGMAELSAAPPPGTLHFDFTTASGPGTGVGVDCVATSSWGGCREWIDDPGEIDSHEVLTLRFLDEPVAIESFTVAGLSHFEWGVATGESFVRVFMGDGTGLMDVDLGANATWISFHARLWSDYSLVSLDYSGATSPMPEANSALLFVIGGVLVGGAVTRRSRRRDD
jgi:hypothetical protein